MSENTKQTFTEADFAEDAGPFTEADFDTSTLPLGTMKPESGVEQGLAGFAGGLRGLMPSSGALSRAIFPTASDAGEVLLKRIYARPFEESVDRGISSVEAPETFGGKVARAGGGILPLLVPIGGGSGVMGRGIGLIERPVERVLAGMKPGVIKSVVANILKPAIGLGGFSGAHTALEREDVTGGDVLASTGEGARVGAIFGPASKVGSTLIPGKAGAVLGGATGGLLTGGPEDAVVMGALGLLGKTSQLDKERMVRSSGRMLKRFINPTKRDYDFGFNPPEAVAQEGLSAKSTLELKNKVSERLNLLNETKDRALKSGAGDTPIEINRRKILDPLFERLNKLKKDPKPHSEEIKNIEETLSSLYEGKISNVYDAYDFAERIRNLTGKMAEGVGGDYDKALRSSRHNVMEAIGKRVVGLRELNMRIGNLIRAEEGIERTIEGEKPFIDKGLISAVSLPIEPLKSAFLRTGYAKMVTPKYGKPTIEIGQPNVASGGEVVDITPEQPLLPSEGSRKLLPPGRIPPGRRLIDERGGGVIRQRSELSELGQINLPSDLAESYRYLQDYGGKAINLPPWSEIVASREALKASGVSEANVNEIIRQHLIEKVQRTRGSL